MSAALKLFGKTIPLPDDPPPPRTPDSLCVEDPFQGNSAVKLDAIDHKDVTSHLGALDESQSADHTRTEVEINDTSASEEKNLKKPDKIIQCPRCSSMDTKFCYYNNYNVNQPRHYCKNCQRYWTAGGNIRNVPIGAGRRKGKNVQYQSPADVLNAFHQQSFRPNLSVGTVLSFGSENPLCESVTSALNLGKNEILTDYSTNGLGTNAILTDYNRLGNSQISIPGGGSDLASALASISSRIKGNQTETTLTESNFAKFLPQVPNHSNPWRPSWNPDGISHQLPNHSSASSPGFPMPCHPQVGYWGCTMPGTWTSPWLARLPSPIQIIQESNPASPKLGKHLRDENILSVSTSAFVEEENLHNHIWFPKALRIGESRITNSSNLEALEGPGINIAKAESTTSTGLVDTAMQANPAALSRSLNFNESS